MPFSITLTNGFHYLRGDLDETADISSLALAASPIRMNLRELKRANSIGLGRLLAMVLKRFDAKLEYHESPTFFIETINTIPRLLGAKTDPKAVRSILLPFVCPGCHEETTDLLKMEHFRREGLSYQMDPRPCSKCGILLGLGVDPDDFFDFLDLSGK